MGPCIHVEKHAKIMERSIDPRRHTHAAETVV